MTRLNHVRLGAAVLASAAILATTTTFARAGAQGTVTLRYNMKKGQKLVYATTTTGVPGMPTGGATSTIEILQAGPKGFTAKTSTVMNSNSGMTPPSTTVSYDLLGKPTSNSPMGGMGGLAESAGFMGIVFPSGPVKVGSTWTVKVDVAKSLGATGMGSMMKFKKSSIVPVNYKITGITNRGSKKVATVSVSAIADLDMEMTPPPNSTKGAAAQQPMSMQMAMNVSGQAVIDTATGILQQQDTTGTMTIAVMGRKQTVPLKTSTKLK